MGLMQQIQSGRTSSPPRIMVYGTEGIGKSTLAARAPQPVFVQTEDGLGEIDCHKFPLAGNFDDVIAALTELHAEEHDFQSIVVDSLDWLERLIWDAVCETYGAKSIEKVDGGLRTSKRRPSRKAGTSPRPNSPYSEPVDRRRRQSVRRLRR